MKILEMTLEAIEPLVITSGSAESMAHTSLDYIPGSMLLGAFASLWIHNNPGCPDASPIFQSLFLNGEISWGCAFPLCAELQTVPVPLSYRREKGRGALPVAGLPFEKGKFAVANLLALPEEESEEKLRATWQKELGKDALVPKSRNIGAVFMNPHTLRQPDLRKVWNTRVALGKQRSALEGQLFGFSALAPGSIFRSEIYCHSQEAAAALVALVDGVKSIRVGHARSAGYGLVRLACASREQEREETGAKGEYNIFLQSHYLPDPPWADPLANLLSGLEARFGAKPELVQTFANYTQIEGFCSHWRKPRDSRMGLSQGSCLKIKFPGSLLQKFELGADNLEGYGRILVNPPFLGDIFPQIQALAEASPQKSQYIPDSLATPFWRILRSRSLSRLARQQALAWLEEKKWQEFLEDAARLAQPSPSQLANLLYMTEAMFRTMLGKTPGQQWKSAVARNPFGEGREHLDAIVTSLLQLPVFLRSFPLADSLALAGGKPDAREREELSRQGHALFKRELVRTWLKTARSRREGGQ